MSKGVVEKKGGIKGMPVWASQQLTAALGLAGGGRCDVASTQSHEAQLWPAGWGSKSLARMTAGRHGVPGGNSRRRADGWLSSVSLQDGGPRQERWGRPEEMPAIGGAGIRSLFVCRSFLADNFLSQGLGPCRRAIRPLPVAAAAARKTSRPPPHTTRGALCTLPRPISTAKASTVAGACDHTSWYVLQTQTSPDIPLPRTAHLPSLPITQLPQLSRPRH